MVAPTAISQTRRHWPRDIPGVPLIKHRWLEILMVAPLVTYILGFTLLPSLNVIYMSLQEKGSAAFPTLVNYRYIFERPQFAQAVLNTLVITIVGLALEMTVGVIIALILALLSQRVLPIMTYYYPVRGGAFDAATYATILALTVFLVTLWLQRWLRTGYLAGAVKG